MTASSGGCQGGVTRRRDFEPLTAAAILSKCHQVRVSSGNRPECDAIPPNLDHRGTTFAIDDGHRLQLSFGELAMHRWLQSRRFGQGPDFIRFPLAPGLFQAGNQLLARDFARARAALIGRF